MLHIQHRCQRFELRTQHIQVTTVHQNMNNPMVVQQRSLRQLGTPHVRDMGAAQLLKVVLIDNDRMMLIPIRIKKHG